MTKILRENPFITLTIVASIIGWITAFAGACLLKMLNGAWWVMVYEFIITFSQTVIIFSGSIESYRITMMALLSSSIPLLIIQIDYVIQYTRSFVPKGPANVYVAGYIILVIIQASTNTRALKQYLWILIYGSKSTTFFGRLGNIRDMDEHMYYSEKMVPTSVILEEVVDKNHADVEDPNELEFEKDEILEVVDTKGSWWQARKHNGAVGIVPGNYVSIN
ncbi:hypothetical protein BY458DRAFT_474127 [Sporodiniella umbellata]|nr:hypothetical protein BY458DRAFT_474127 [Sporodiniella umbellata]